MELNLGYANHTHRVGRFQARRISRGAAGKPKGGLVVIQEIFGVNHHIRAVCDRFAAIGYRRGRAGGVRSHPAEFRIRLYARRDRPCAHHHSQDRLGRDDARHRGRDRQRQIRRQGRHRRLLHGRHRRVPRGRQAQRAVGRRSATTAARSPRTSTRSRRCRRSCISATRTSRSRCPTSRLIKQKRPDCEIHVYQAPATASAATSAAATTRRPQGGVGAHCRLAQEIRRIEKAVSAQNQRSATLMVSPGRTGVPSGTVARTVCPPVARLISTFARARARREAARDRDRGLDRHVGDVRVLAGKRHLAEDEERPVGLDLDRDMRLADEALTQPRRDRGRQFGRGEPARRDRRRSAAW